MYESFYGLTEKPFNLTPDPRFLFLSEKHKEAFAHLLYGIKNRTGFIMVSGEIGTGKTTICRSLLNQLDPDVELAFIFNPCLSPDELLRKINEDFGIESRADSLKALIDELNEYLLDRNAKGKNCVLVIDEAQNLSPGVLEQIRLLSNLETETQKLLQIVLIGQPELAMCLQLPELRQLNQRITARYHLKPLNMEETVQYIAYRLRVAGGRRKVHFTRGALRAIYKSSGGTPRVINAVADRALLIGYTKEARDITKKIVLRAIKEIRGAEIKQKKRWRTALARFLPNPALVSSALVIIGLAVVLVKYITPVQYVGQLRNVREIAAANDDLLTGIAEAKSFTDSDDPGAPLMLLPEAAANETAALPTPAAAPAPTASVSAAVEENVSPADKFASIDPAASRNAALAAVMRAWNMAALGDYPGDDGVDSLAAFARAHDLDAETLSPTAEQILALNMPALAMFDADGRKMWVAVVGSEGDDLLVTADAPDPVRMSREDFNRLYAHEALILWRNDKPKAQTLARGSEGEAVHYLQRALRAMDRLNIEPTGKYNDETAKAVQRIQEETGLTVDGVTGRQVRMVLASWLSGKDVPALREKKDYVVPDAPPVQKPTQPKRKRQPKAETAEVTPTKSAPAVDPAPVPAEPPAPTPAPAHEEKPAEPAPAPDAAPAPSAEAPEQPADTQLLTEEPDPHQQTVSRPSLPQIESGAPDIRDDGALPSNVAVIDVQNLPAAPYEDHLPPVAVTPDEDNVTPPRVSNIFMMPTKPKADL